MVAQDIVQVSVGPDYTSQAYYTLSNDNITSLVNDSWDLAFTTGTFDAGVHYNEAIKSAMGALVPTLALYLAPTNNFDDVIDVSDLVDSLYNPDKSWDYGAFNSVRNPDNLVDFGWGMYNPATHVVEGNKVFVLKLRDDRWKKIRIESLANGILTVKYADLDGGNEKAIEINKTNYSASPLALFSFETENLTTGPANWDLLFTRYVSEQDAGGGNIVQYPVTGALSGRNVEVAEARDIDPIDVDHEDFIDSLKTDIDIIGWDWKRFDLGAFKWILDDRRAYFIKTPSSRLWKIFFTEFAGSRTGNIVFDKTDLGQLTAVENDQGNFVDFGVFPNPVDESFTISFSLKNEIDNVQIRMVDALGKTHWRSEVKANVGLNVLDIRRPKLSPGNYIIQVSDDTHTLSRMVFMK